MPEPPTPWSAVPPRVNALSGGSTEPDLFIKRIASGQYLHTNAYFRSSVGLQTATKSGAPTDSDIPSGFPTAGALIVDTTNNRLYVKVTGGWRYATLTA